MLFSIFSKEKLPKDDFQANIFEKSKNINFFRKQIQISLVNSIFNDEKCDDINDTYINVDVTISGCQSINKGITFISNHQDGNAVKIANSIFILGSSHSETSMLVFQGTILDISNVTFKISKEGQLLSTPIFDCSDLPISSSPSINSLTFVDCSLDSNTSIFRLSNYPSISFTDLQFEGENIHCKSFLESDTNSSVQFINCNFSNFNENSTIFALNYIKGELYFTSCRFFDNKCSLFHLYESNSNLITFSKCHFFDNNATDILSFIYLIGSQTMKQTIFTDCQFWNNFIYSTDSTQNRYGTVIGLSSSLHFEGTNMFTNCHTISIDLSKTNNYGGALTIIHVKEIPYKLENCSFDGCSASSMGGGLFSCLLSEEKTDDSTIVLHLTNCNFTNCWSLENGGGLSCGHSFFMFFYSGQTELRITSSLFKECKSPIGGGIFFKDQSEIGFEQAVIKETTFDNCQGKNGTAFYIRSDYFTLTNSSFINHYTDAADNIDGHSFSYIYLNTAHEKTMIQIKETVFMNNSGQCIEIYSPSKTAMATMNSFENCQFINNNQLVENHTLINCEHVQADITGFTNCSFINNRGRCIYSEMIHCVFLSIGYTTFKGNYGLNGLCVCLYSDSIEENDFALENNVFINNTVNCKSSSLIQGGIISNRNVFMEVSGTNLFKDNQIISNDDGASGSAFFVELKQAKSIALTGFIFENCSAIESGGAVFVTSSVSDESHEIKFFNCSFINNKIKENGGAIFIETKGATKIAIDNSYFMHNIASVGGSIYIKESSLSPSSNSASVEVSSSEFSNDEADEKGGSIYISSYSKVAIQSNNFTQTKANVQGMVILIDLLSKVVWKDNNLYIDEDVKDSSALYVFSSYLSEKAFEGALEIDGGCFTSAKKSLDDNKAVYLVYNVSQTSNLTITSASCFQGSKDESILIIGNSTKVFFDDSVFDCDKCDVIVPVESDSSSEVQPTETETIFNPTETNSDIVPSSSIVPEPTSIPDDGDGGHKKFGAGTIIGIVLAVISVVSLIVIIIIYARRRKTQNDDNLLGSIDFKEKINY